MSNRLRKIGLGLAVGIGVIFSLLRLVDYLTTGGVSIITRTSGASIQLTGINPDGSRISKAFSVDAAGKLSAQVKAGTYKVVVQEKSSLTHKIITVQARQSASYALELKDTATPEPVYGSGAKGLVASKSGLRFINSATGLMSEITDQNELKVVDSVALRSLRWAKPGLGLAEDGDTFYLIKDGTLSPLKAPFKIKGNAAVSYDIAKGGDNYLSNGEAIYSGGSGGDYKYIYGSGDNYNASISGGANVVAFIEKQSSDNSTDVVVVDKAKQVVRKKIPAEQIVWSPDGKALAVVVNGSSSAIYNQSLEKVAVLPNNNPTNLAWLDNTTLFYASENFLWSYDLPHQQATARASLTPNTTLDEIAPSPEGDYVYLASKTPAGADITRVGLRGQKAPELVYKLGIFFPVSFETCTVNYVNFSAPTMLLAIFAEEVTPGACEAAARNELSQDGIDPSTLHYNTTPFVQNFE